MHKKITFFFSDEKQPVLASQEQTILESLIENNIDISHSCGGFATCGTCVIEVVQGLDKFDPRNELENELCESRKWEPNKRLCCQNLVKEEMVIRLPINKKRI